MGRIILFLLLAGILNAQIIFNEFMIDPDNDNTGEFIEIYNAGDSTLNLTSFFLCDAQDTDAILPFPDSFLLPDHYGIILDPDYSGDYDELIADSIPRFTISDVRFGMYGISNSTSKPFSLLSSNGFIEDQYRTGVPDWPDPGHSMERIRFLDSLWHQSDSLFGTPGSRNSSAPKERDIRIDDLAVHTNQNTIHISFTIGNPGLSPLANYSIGYIVDISTFTAEYNDTLIFYPDYEIPPDSIFVFNFEHAACHKGSFDVLVFCSISGNDPDTLLAAGYLPLEESDMIVTEFLCQTGDIHDCEYIELFSKCDQPIQLKGITLSDMTGSTCIVSDYVLSPDLFIVLAQSALFYDDYPDILNVIIQPAWRSLNNSEDIIRLQNPSGSLIFNLHYDSVWDLVPDCAMQLIDTALSICDPYNWEPTSTPSPGQPNQSSRFLYHLSCFPEHAFFTSKDTLCFYVINDGYFMLPEQTIRIVGGNSDVLIPLSLSNPGDTLIIYPDLHGQLSSGTHECLIECDPYFSNSFYYYIPYLETPVYINEVLFDPIDTYGQDEFIELGIPSGHLELSNWVLRVNNSIMILNGRSDQTHLVLCDNTCSLPVSRPVTTSRFVSLPNAGAEIALIDPEGTVMDECDLRDHQLIAKGKSLEKQIISYPSNQPEFWFASVAETGMSPGKRNSVSALPGSHDAVDIFPEIFYPDHDDRIQFSIDSSSPLSFCELFCFDMAGQCIYTYSQSLYNYPSLLHYWDGKMDSGNFIKRGLYPVIAILHMANGNQKILKTVLAIR